jgi:hypothetical protein
MQTIHSKLCISVKAHLNVFDWDKSKKEKEALLISEAIVTTEKKLSSLNTTSIKEMEMKSLNYRNLLLMQRLFPYECVKIS